MAKPMVCDVMLCICGLPTRLSSINQMVFPAPLMIISTRNSFFVLHKDLASHEAGGVHCDQFFFSLSFRIDCPPKTNIMFSSEQFRAELEHDLRLPLF